MSLSDGSMEKGIPKYLVMSLGPTNFHYFLNNHSSGEEEDPKLEDL